jgi:hypothetical protein
MLVGELGVELSYPFRQMSVGKLAAPRFQRSPDPLPVVETIHMERAIALVSTHFSTAWSEERTGPEVSPERVQFAVCLHGVHITSKPTKSMD